MTDRVRETTGGVEAAVRQMYAALGNPAGFDRFLHEDITIWESDQPGPRIGLEALQSLREKRSAAAAETSSSRPQVAVEDLLVDRWGDVAAVARYVLSARVGDDREEFRVTDVLHRDHGGWRIVHHHAEAVPVTVRDTGTEENTHAG